MPFRLRLGRRSSVGDRNADWSLRRTRLALFGLLVLSIACFPTAYVLVSRRTDLVAVVAAFLYGTIGGVIIWSVGTLWRLR